MDSGLALFRLAQDQINLRTNIRAQSAPDYKNWKSNGVKEKLIT